MARRHRLLDHLARGGFSFFQDGGFVGETTMDRLKPAERRFLPFGEDLDLALARTVTSHDRSPHALHHVDGVLVEHLVERQTFRLELSNRSGQPRKAYVALDLPRHASLEGEELDWDEQWQVPLVIVSVPAGERVEQVLKVGRPQTIRREELTVSALEGIAARPGWPEPIQAALASALQAAKKRDAAQKEADLLARERTRVGERIDQLRADLVALGKAGSPTRATARMSSKLVAAQEELTRLTERHEASSDRARRHARAVLRPSRCSSPDSPRPEDCARPAGRRERSSTRGRRGLCWPCARARPG